MSSRPPVPPRFGTPLPPRPNTTPGTPTIGMRAPQVPPKPSGLIGAINPGGIETVAELGSGGMNPIWLVSMKGAAYKIVLKLEKQFKDDNYKNTPQLAKGNIKAMSNIMATVSPSATMEAASPRELDALQGFVGLPDSLKKELPNIRNGTFNLVKMKYDSTFASHSNLGVEKGGFSSMSEKDKDEARKLLEAIRGKRRVWQNLGSITIADALIGNNDRVDISNGGVTNFGNLIFSARPTARSPMRWGWTRSIRRRTWRRCCTAPISRTGRTSSGPRSRTRCASSASRKAWSRN